LKRVCVFCGSSPGARPAYATAARQMGVTLARRGLGLVYGGASVGTMGMVADATLAAGGEAIGVIPRSLQARELAHGGLTRLYVVESMHDRKALMADLADGFIALPGGMGTMEEMCEVLTWAQLGLHGKPCALLDVEGYYDPLIGFFDHAVAEGFLRPEHRAMVIVGQSGDEVLDAMSGWVAPAVPKWIGRDQI
jgi:uncharacterized protein (TIGR00730 family)